MSSSIILLIIPPLLLLLILQSIDAWTPRLSASHFNSGGRFFHYAHSNTNTPLSLKATENNNHPPEDEDTTNNNSNEEDTLKNNASSNKGDKKKEGTYLTAEYLSQLESLYASSSSSAAEAEAVSSSSLSSTYSLLEPLTEDHTITSTSSSTSSSSSPGQSLLYGEKIHTVVLGDWMEWEGEVEGGKNSYSSSSSSCFGENCGDDSEQCDIPEHYKEFKGSHPKVDVMSFLGIKRAEPIQVQRDWD